MRHVHVTDEQRRAAMSCATGCTPTRSKASRAWTMRRTAGVRGVAVPAIPMTISGKKMEIPVRRILQGTPIEQAADPNAMLDPAALDAFAAHGPAAGPRGGLPRIDRFGPRHLVC